MHIANITEQNIMQATLCDLTRWYLTIDDDHPQQPLVCQRLREQLDKIERPPLSLSDRLRSMIMP